MGSAPPAAQLSQALSSLHIALMRIKELRSKCLQFLYSMSEGNTLFRR